MASLRRKEEILIQNLSIADQLWSRTKGLLGHSQLAENEALWIHRCNSIHTWFMKFPIDCVFLDRSMKVKKVFQNVTPWKMTFPVWGASSVIEMQSGMALKLKIQEGDELYVGA